MPSASDPDTPPGRPVLPPSLRSLARIVFVLVTIAALLAPGAESTAQQQSAPVLPTDEMLLDQVRQAGLWEMPAGLMALQKSSSKVVKDVGFALMVDHGRLDFFTRDLAAKLGVQLPTVPTNSQAAWLREMLAASGPQFDSIFVNRLRAAHGVIFSILAQVRAGTRNDQIRAYATTGNQAVLRHISLLESTGLVDHNLLPDPVIVGAAAPSEAQLGLDGSQIVLTAALVLLAGGGLFYALRLVKGRRSVRARLPRRAVAATRTGGGHD